MGIDWKWSDEQYQYGTFGHFGVFDRPDRNPEHRSPLQRAMREIKGLRGQRYWDHIVECGGHSPLPDFMHESWFQLPARQKEEHLLRDVDWSGISAATREKVIGRELRARDGEINAQDEWRLHDQLMRVESITPGWDRLSSTAKLDTLATAKEVDWRPFSPEFQAVALGHMIRREVEPAAEGFRIVGVFEAKGDYPHFGRYVSSKDRDAHEQSMRKGPKRPLISKAEARDNFRWSVARPRWEAIVREHATEGDPARIQALREDFRKAMRPLWQEFWAEAKTLGRDEMTLMSIGWRPKEQSYDRAMREAAEQSRYRNNQEKDHGHDR